MSVTLMLGDIDGPDEEFERALHCSMFAADTAAIRRRAQSDAAPHEVTKAAVRAALEMLLGNGLIRLVPSSEWPEYLSLDPPYGALRASFK